MTDTFEVVRFGALGTTAELAVTDPAALEPARRVLVDELAVVDAACSRFRDDSDLVRVNEGAGRWIPVGHELIEALLVALRVARLTAGAVDPTVGRAMRRLGYDRDFSQVAPTGPAVTVTFSRIPGWQTVEVDPARSLVRRPRRGPGRRRHRGRRAGRPRRRRDGGRPSSCRRLAGRGRR